MSMHLDQTWWSWNVFVGAIVVAVVLFFAFVCFLRNAIHTQARGIRYDEYERLPTSGRSYTVVPLVTGGHARVVKH